MGCFLACFGLSRKQKRRRPATLGLIGDQFHASYQHLHLSKCPSFHFRIPLAKDFRDEPEKQPRQKVRKKVSFNLNVQTYEAVPDEYFLSDTEKDIQVDKSRKETASQNAPHRELSSSLYPPNHRYQNSSYDEDDISIQKSDSEGEDGSQSEEELSEEESATRPSDDGKPMLRSLCEHSVLKPIENLTQWKKAKAKTAVPGSNQRSSEHLMAEIKVGAKPWKIK